MAFQTKELTGAMFKNNRKEKETHPDMTGEINIDGTIYWQSAWKKTDKNGETYYSQSFKKKDFTEAKKAVENTQVYKGPEIDDTAIPF